MSYEIEDSKLNDQKVIISGEPELEAELERKVNGIPLVNAVVKDLNELAEKLSVAELNGI